MGVSPGHAAVVTHPAVLLLVVAAAGLAGVHAAVQTLTFTVDQELKGLQAADAVRVRQFTLSTQQLSLCILLLDFSLQITARDNKRGNEAVTIIFQPLLYLRRKYCLLLIHFVALFVSIKLIYSLKTEALSESI